MNLKKENCDLEQLVSLLEDEEIVTFQDGRYCDEVREVIMDLLSMDVSMNQVNNVIKTVLKKLANKSVSRLPSMGLKSRLLLEARWLAKCQVAAAMETDTINPDEGNCLHGDGTTKYHRKYQNFQISTKSGRSYTIGMTEMAGGDTAATMKAFVDIVSEMSETFNDATDTESKNIKMSKLLASIKSTMSDQGPVNPCFNAELKQMRETVLPSAIENWDLLSKENQKRFSEMANFFCKMHMLPNFALEVDKTLRAFEDLALKSKDSQYAFQTTESGASRLVRTSAKAVHPHGSDEAGIASDFKSFLKGKSKELEIVSFRGNRFNILFYDAGALYYHWDDLYELLTSWPSPNRLLLAMKEDMDNEVHKAGVRSLGIIDKLITGPFWRLIEKKGSILEMNPHLLQMKNKLEVWGIDASPLLRGKSMFDPKDVELHRDKIWDQLFMQTENVSFDTLTQQALEMCMHSLLLVLERLSHDQLPGGKYFSPSDSVKKIAKNVPKTNKISEADFAILDLLIRKKPNASINALDALIMWSQNKTMKWLDTLSSEEKTTYLEQARKGAQSMAEKFKIRKEQLEQEKMDVLHKKLQAKLDSEAKQNEKKAEATNALAKIGQLWTKEEEVDDLLYKEFDNDKARVEAILSQIKFRKVVLKSSGQRWLFNKTKVVGEKRVDLSLEELANNLKELIRLNPVRSMESKEEEPSASKLRPKEQRDVQFQVEKSRLYVRLQDARKKRLISHQKEKLPELLADPEKLVGKRIKHKVVEQFEEEAFWCDGTVLELTENNLQNPIKTIYKTHYDIDPIDANWNFPLLVDLKKGDVIILS